MYCARSVLKQAWDAHHTTLMQKTPLIAPSDHIYVCTCVLDSSGSLLNQCIMHTACASIDNNPRKSKVGGIIFNM
jgi:hypothetical protein